MRLKFVLPGLSLLLLSPAVAQQSGSVGSSAVSAPSLELLEFLADFGEYDETTFEMIKLHAEQDLEKDNSGNADDQINKPELSDEK